MKNLLYVLLITHAIHLSATFYSELSSLEKSLVDDGLLMHGLKAVEAAEGKIVRKIYVITNSPFSPDSGFLSILNNLHINTREDVIRREIFQKEGEIYDAAAIRDSETALRAQGLVRALAVIVPVQKIDEQLPNEVDLLVATRDLLSLRPSFSFKGYGSFPSKEFALTNLMVTLGEHSLLGYNKSIAAIYEMQQGAHVFSARYFDPRLFGSRYQFSIKPSLIFASQSFAFDGALGDLKIERPLLAQTDRWAYGLDLSYGSRPIIDFNGTKVRTYEIRGSNGMESFERKYRWRYAKNSLFGRYSFGTTYKREIFGSYGLNIKKPIMIDDAHLDAEQREIFKKNILPRDELESFISLGFAYFHNEFLKLYDYDNYRLQEIKRTGPSVVISNDFSSKEILQSDTNFLRPELKLGYLVPLYKDSFANLTFSSIARFDGEWSDIIVKYGLTLVSPKIWVLGRLVAEGRLSTVGKNRDNQKFILGSDTGIRGVDSRFYIGDKGFRVNVEFRTAPLDVWIFHGGLVFFYDVGSAFDSWQRANATHALGIGFRFLAPQISAVPFRFDLAFPIYGVGKDLHVVVPSFGTGQGF